MGEKQLAQIPCAEVLRDLRQLCAEGALVGLCQRSTVHRAVREQLRQALSHLCVGVKRRGGRGSCHGRAELLHRIAHVAGGRHHLVGTREVSPAEGRDERTLLTTLEAIDPTVACHTCMS